MYIVLEKGWEYNDSTYDERGVKRVWLRNTYEEALNLRNEKNKERFLKSAKGDKYYDGYGVYLQYELDDIQDTLQNKGFEFDDKYIPEILNLETLTEDQWSLFFGLLGNNGFYTIKETED